MHEIDCNSQIKVEKITFQVLSHFREEASESIDEKLCNLMLQEQEKMITKPNS